MVHAGAVPTDSQLPSPLSGILTITGVGHRVVHGMTHTEPKLVTPDLLGELHRISPYDPDHLPREIKLIEAFRQRQPKLPQASVGHPPEIGIKNGSRTKHWQPKRRFKIYE
jgi:hypothetical protein